MTENVKPTTDVKRYYPIGPMAADDHGYYVKYEDYASLRTQLQEAREKLNRAYIDEVYQDNEIRELAERLETAMEILNACEIDLKIRLNSLKAFGGGSGVERIEDTLSRISSFLHDGKVKP